MLSAAPAAADPLSLRAPHLAEPGEPIALSRFTSEASALPDAAAAGLRRMRHATTSRAAALPEITPRIPRIVDFPHRYAPGTVVVSNAERALYFVLEGGRAYRYRVAIGQTTADEDLSWRGARTISGIVAWPSWRPTDRMRERDPSLPEFMDGGPGNPLGARAIYLGSSYYRIHGTNSPRSIGRAASSGCFRMHNRDIVHLASLVEVGARVVVIDRFGETSKARSASAKAKRPPTSAAKRAKPQTLARDGAAALDPSGFRRKGEF